MLNVAAIWGTLSSDPVERVLPSEDRLISYEVTCKIAGRPTETVNAVWLGATSRQPPTLAAGDEVVITGRVRRRFFRAAGATASRTEVVAQTVHRATQLKGVQKALDDVAGIVLEAASR